MTKAFTVSVVIPCFNHGVFLPEAVASVTNLKRDDVELIVVDDGSTDERTHQEVDRLIARGIHVIRQKNQGLAAARNAGIRAARGEFILPLDSDNRIRESYLVAGLKRLQNAPDLGVVYGNAEYFGEKTGVWPVPEFDLLHLVQWNFIDACALYRKQVWESIGGYDEKMPWMGWEDWDFWLRAAVNGWGFSHLNEVAFDYRVRAGSMIGETNRHAEELYGYIFGKRQNQAAGLLREQISELKRLREIEASRAYRIGNSLIAPARRLEADVASALKIQPNVTMSRLAIYAHYSPTPDVARHVFYYLDQLASSGFNLCFVSNSELSPASRERLEKFCDHVIVRENTGLDFSMWQAGMAKYDLSNFSELLLTNSSIVGPLRPLAALWQHPKVAACDFWGLTDNDEHGVPHLQSFFLVFKRPVFCSQAFKDFWRSVLPYQRKQHVILSYEMGLTSWLEQAGFKWQPLFQQREIHTSYLKQRSFFRKVKDRLRQRRLPGRNITLHFPDYLFERGMPFLKMEVLVKGCCRVEREKILEALKTSDLPAEAVTELVGRRPH